MTALTRLLTLLCLMAFRADGQLPRVPGSADAEKEAVKAADPYGRSTPRSAFLNFISAAQRENPLVASRYLQLPESATGERRERIVRQLHFVLDRAFRGDIDQISRSETGSVSDGLPEEVERAGVIHAPGDDVDVLLVRTRTADGPIWLISTETLAQIPRLYTEVGYTGVEANLPRWLVDRTLFWMPLWMFFSVILLLPAAFGISYLIVAALIAVYRRVRKIAAFSVAAPTNRRPYVFILGLLLHYWAINALGIPLLYRQYYTRFLGLLIIFGVGWLVFQLIDRIGLRLMAELENRGSVQSAMLLTKRILKALVFIGLVLLALQQLGFNVAPALATLGIGGLAIALAAQKTIENLFGGISVLSDRVIRVGDFVKIDTLMGTVEDIGLRSTRIRTLERTVVSVPNGTLAAQNLENFALRDKFWFHPLLSLRYETTPDQMRAVLADIRQLLYSHAKVLQDGARVRLVAFGASSLDLEIFAYVQAADMGEFLAIKEDLMLRIMDIVQNAGTGFAFPSQTLYLARDAGISKEAAESAEGRIRDLAGRQQLPFPDHTQEQIEQTRGSIEYPPKDSILRQQ